MSGEERFGLDERSLFISVWNRRKNRFRDNSLLWSEIGLFMCVFSWYGCVVVEYVYLEKI